MNINKLRIDLKSIVIEISNKSNNTIANVELEKFENYLNDVITIGSFNVNSWTLDWREVVWEFGSLFKHKDPKPIIDILDKKHETVQLHEKEVLDFIKSEILFSFLPEDECISVLLDFIRKYPFNPEFRHTIGHFFKDKSQYELANENYKLALKFDPSNHVYLRHRFNNDYEYLISCIREDKLEIGKEHLKNLFVDKCYEKNAIYHNILTDFNLRFDDHMGFQAKIKTLENTIHNNIKEDLENERKKIIEILGFFSAIIAFIFSTVSIGKNFKFDEAIVFISLMGLVLLIFATVMSLLFTKK